MKELIDKIKGINNLFEIDNYNDIDAKVLFLAIIKANRYDLLKDFNRKLHIDNDEISKELVKFLLSNYYLIEKYGYSFSKENINQIFEVICHNYYYDYEIEDFVRCFFDNKESLNVFVKEHEEFFVTYLGNEKSYTGLGDNEVFIELILKCNYINLVRNLENYSVSNLKLLAQLLEKDLKISSGVGGNRYAKHLFDLKEDLEPNEFCKLLNLLVDRRAYDVRDNKSGKSSFTELVKENIDYLLNVVSQAGFIPKCLVESVDFRDECIKRNRIDLAVKCVLPKDIFQNDQLSLLYCNELKISLKDFFSRGKWIMNYYEKNNNVFNSLIATTIKDNLFNLGEEHVERFINDISIQISLARLNDQEIKILNEILKRYNYETYDISEMIKKILNNISDYNELINSLELSLITEEEIKILVSIMQISKNPYNIVNIDDVRNYRNKKKTFFESNYGNSNLDVNKDNLLKLIFNINLNEAIFINNKFCYDEKKNVLEDLKDSELPKDLLEYLIIINKIVESNNLSDIIRIYNKYKDNNIYSSELLLETYLRSEYTKLYSETLYRIEEKESIYGPQDSIYRNINYNGKSIKICVPRENFNFLIHCVGGYSLQGGVIDTNYQRDWEGRPQIQDHLVACSFIDERRIYSTYQNNKIILGFNTLEGSALLAMGDTDIDSIGYYSYSYNPSIELMEMNKNRAHYFVPSLLANSDNFGHNELVIERRNGSSRRKDLFKRGPDYIIMMADSLEQENFTYLNDLYDRELSFISKEDRELIYKINTNTELKTIITKYKEIIIERATEQNITGGELAYRYISLIEKAKYFEENLKASSEFDVPLVVVDRAYYFNKILLESKVYDEETKRNIAEFYLKSKDKKTIFNKVVRGVDISQIFEKKQTTSRPKLSFG